MCILLFLPVISDTSDSLSFTTFRLDYELTAIMKLSERTPCQFAQHIWAVALMGHSGERTDIVIQSHLRHHRHSVGAVNRFYI
jgi:hypothetical protein